MEEIDRLESERNLIIGVEYYLDDTLENTGRLHKIEDKTIYFERVKGLGYVDSKGIIPFAIRGFKYKEV